MIPEKIKLYLGFLFLIIVALCCGCGDSECVSGDCLNGQGIWISADGHKYIGDWKDGKMEG